MLIDSIRSLFSIMMLDLTFFCIHYVLICGMSKYKREKDFKRSIFIGRCDSIYYSVFHRIKMRISINFYVSISLLILVILTWSKRELELKSLYIIIGVPFIILGAFHCWLYRTMRVKLKVLVEELDVYYEIHKVYEITNNKKIKDKLDLTLIKIIELTDKLRKSTDKEITENEKLKEYFNRAHKQNKEHWNGVRYKIK